jgi:hypothetical protein
LPLNPDVITGVTSYGKDDACDRRWAAKPCNGCTAQDIQVAVASFRTARRSAREAKVVAMPDSLRGSCKGCRIQRVAYKSVSKS